MGQFLPKVFLPSVLVFLFGFILMGGLAILSRQEDAAPRRETAPVVDATASTQPGAEAPAAVVSETPRSRKPKPSYLPHLAALRQIEDFTDRIADYPAQCPSHTPKSEYRQHQCDDLFNDLWMSGVIASVPFLLLGIFLIWAFESLNRVYLRVRRQIIQSQTVTEGVVTNPPVGSNDWFGWFYCFRAIVVQLSNQTQVRVYMPVVDRIPPAGSKLAIYGGQSLWGKSRLYGIHFESLAAQIEVVSAAARASVKKLKRQ